MSKHKVIRGCNVNLNGLCNKVHVLQKFVQSNDLQLVCVTESHLTSEIMSSIVELPGFVLLRNDVKGQVHKHGVCAFIHEDLPFDSISYPASNVLMFRLIKCDLYIIIVYRPPSYRDSQNDQLALLPENITVGKEAILLGDFNLPNVCWRASDQLPTGSVSSAENKFLEAVNSVGLIQWVTEPTYPKSGNILDLLFTTEPDCIGKVEIEQPLPACDHCPVIFEYLPSGDMIDEATVQRSQQLAWHKGNYTRLSKKLSNIDWDFEFAFLNVSEAYDRFIEKVTEVVKVCVPEKRVSLPEKEKWKKNPPKKLVKEKDEAWNSYKGIRLEYGRKSAQAKEAFSHFAILNKKIRTHLVHAQSQYEQGLIERFKENPKFLHAYIRGKKTAQSSVCPLRLADGKLNSEARVMNECFASAFCSVYNSEVPPNQEPHQRYPGHIDPLDITVQKVETMLRETDVNTAMGPDNIHPKVLKMCAQELAHPLYQIFVQSLQEGSLPDAWKKSVVVPIFKKGSRFDPFNYRPVSITSVPCKKMEKIIVESMQKYLETNAIMSSHQFGFRSGRSTMEQLLLVYEHVAEYVDKGNVMDVILFDYSKAFDVVCHQVLLRKLSCIGIDGQLLEWLGSFLTDRTMQVCVKGQLSSQRKVLSGVPQGSVLGPLLFLIYINHIGAELSCSYKIFADDLKLYACVGKREMSLDSQVGTGEMQADIDRLYKTSISWGLNINRDKCAVLRFSRKSRDRPLPNYQLSGAALPYCESQRDLGVIVDESLKFHEHVASVAHKAAGLCQSFLKATVCRTPEFMLFFFVTHVRPIIEYASCVWNTGYMEDMRTLERIQRKWTKQVEGLGELPYSGRLRELDLYSVQGRLLRADLIEYWKILHGKSSINTTDLFSLASNIGTRGHSMKLNVPRASTEIRQRSFSHRQISLWNSLPEEVVMATSISTFKHLLGKAILHRLYEYV